MEFQFPRIFKRREETSISGEEKRLISLRKLSNDELLLLYKEKEEEYDFHVRQWNEARNPATFEKPEFKKFVDSNTSNEMREEEDEATPKAWKELNAVLSVMREKGLSVPENQ